MLLRLALLVLAAADAPVAITVRAGSSVPLCSTGTIQCPAGTGICDDTSIATIENSDAGVVLRALKAGETRCSVASASGLGMRQLYKVVVKPWAD